MRLIMLNLKLAPTATMLNYRIHWMHFKSLYIHVTKSFVQVGRTYFMHQQMRRLPLFRFSFDYIIVAFQGNTGARDFIVSL